MFATPQQVQLLWAARVKELLQQLTHEIETATCASQEGAFYKMQHDEMQRQISAQSQALLSMQQTISELMHKHTLIVNAKDEEILLLRRHIERTVGGWPQGLEVSAGSKRAHADPDAHFLLPQPQLSQQQHSLLAGANSAGLPSLGLGNSSLASQHAQSAATLAAAVASLSATTPATSSAFSSLPASAPARSPQAVAPADQPARASWDFEVRGDGKLFHGGELQHTMTHDSVVCSVQFSSDGSRLATGCNNAAQLYDVDSGRLLKVLTASGVYDEAPKVAPSTGTESGYYRSLSFGHKTNLLAAGSEDKTVNVWDLDAGKLQYHLLGHELDIYALCFTRDDRFIVSGSGDTTVKLWDVADGSCRRTFGGKMSGTEFRPCEGVTSVTVSADGTTLAAGSLDKHVWVWDVETGNLLHRLPGHADSVYSVAFDATGRTLASGSLDKTVKLWRLNTSGGGASGSGGPGGGSSLSLQSQTLKGHSDFVLSVCWRDGGDLLFSASKDRTVRVWDARADKPCGGSADGGSSIATLTAHSNSILSIAHAPVNDMRRGTFATGSGDRSARVWSYYHGVESGSS